jgi:type II secretory pathway pseudopilin PulG
MRRRRGRGHERGETLIELLFAIAIMGTAVVTILGATATAIHLSDVHRKQATAGAYLRAFAESIEARVAGSPTGYVSCTTKDGPYRSYYTDNTGSYAASVTGVNVWNGTTFVASSLLPCKDLGVQEVSLEVKLDGQADETLAIVIRQPCRSTDPLCA